MKAAIATLLIGMMLPTAGGFAAKFQFKTCFTQSEHTAEQIIRSGLRLREGAIGCDGPPWDFHTRKAWEQVDQQYGPRFKQETDIRRKAFQREFAKDAENNEQMWDGRTVLYFRNYPLSAPYCAEIKDSLDALLKGGWSNFAKKSKLSKDEVEADYRVCG